MSDHSIVTMELELSDNKRGPGYWKFNNLHLEKSDFIELIEATINQAVTACQLLNDRMSWELIKVQVTSQAMEYGAKKQTAQNIKLMPWK